MILKAIVLLVASTLIGSTGTFALFEFFVRRQEKRDASEGQRPA